MIYYCVLHAEDWVKFILLFCFQNKIIIILSLAIMETKNDIPNENMLWNSDNSELGMS